MAEANTEGDDTWEGRGFNSQSEFIRFTLRDAVEYPSFDRDELVSTGSHPGNRTV